ncbi:hypothetical protein HN51_065726 [Arachis hypogaea]|nr:Serine/threonine-protein kinase [Arachis hypogaea]
MPAEEAEIELKNQTRNKILENKTKSRFHDIRLFLEAAELLRHPLLQPYVLRCQNASSNFLPVYPIVNSKDKTKRSKKSSGGKDQRDKDTTSPNYLERIHPIEGNRHLQPRNLPSEGELTASTSAEDNLENRMVDLTSYIVESSTSSSGSKDGSTTSESTICSVCRDPDFKTRPAKETANIEITQRVHKIHGEVLKSSGQFHA